MFTKYRAGEKDQEPAAAAALVVEGVEDLSKQESEVMIPSCRRLCAPLVGELRTGNLKPWQGNLAYWQVRVIKVQKTLTKCSLHWHTMLPEFIVLIVTLSNWLFGFSVLNRLKNKLVV